MDLYTLAMDLIDYQYALKFHHSLQTQQEKFGLTLFDFRNFTNSQGADKGQHDLSLSYLS